MSNVHGIKLSTKTFRRAAPTFIRAMCAAQVKGQYLKLRCKEEAERVTVQCTNVLTNYKQSLSMGTEGKQMVCCSVGCMHDHVKTYDVCSDLEEASVAKHIHNRPLLLLALA